MSALIATGKTMLHLILRSKSGYKVSVSVERKGCEFSFWTATASDAAIISAWKAKGQLDEVMNVCDKELMP